MRLPNTFVTTIHITLALCAVALGACGEPTPPVVDDTPAPHVLDDKIKALDKARGVQDTLDKAHKERTEQLEDDGG